MNRVMTILKRMVTLAFLSVAAVFGVQYDATRIEAVKAESSL